jgi:hypothetical protein
MLIIVAIALNKCVPALLLRPFKEIVQNYSKNWQKVFKIKIDFI